MCRVEKFWHDPKGGITSGQITRFLRMHTHPRQQAAHMKNGEAIIPPTVIDQVWDTKEHLISVNYVVFKKNKKSPVICLKGKLHIICGEFRFLSYFLVNTVIHLCILVRVGLFERPRPFIFSPIISLLDCEKMKRKKCFVTIRGPSIRYLCGRLRGTASHSPTACSTTSSCLWLTMRQWETLRRVRKCASCQTANREL